MQTEPIYLDGQFTKALTSATLDVISPINQQVIGKVFDCNKQDINNAISAAKRALQYTNQTSLTSRIAMAKRFINYLKNNKAEIVRTITLELGSPISYTKSNQFEVYINELDHLLKLIDNFQFTHHETGYDLIKESVGVVACITPWNFPLGQITKKIIPALLMGNTIILKPSSQTPLVASWIARAIHYAGFPRGSFNLITGKGSNIGKLLTSHPDINMITFTGSTEVGTQVASAAVSTMKRITMELGGKSASIILEGANLDIALQKTLDTIFLNSGQTCSALSRLLVPSSMKEEVEQAIIERTQHYIVGDPFSSDTKVGPVQSQSQFEKVKSYIELGIEEEATLLVGEIPNNLYIKPTVFTNVTNNMKIAREEIFGPVLSIISYETVDEAIMIANDSPYGLNGAVFGPDELAQQVATQMKTGNIFINTTDKALNVPFGGYKYSGIGRENGLLGVEEFIEYKALIK